METTPESARPPRGGGDAVMPVDEEDAASDFQPSSVQIKGLCSLLASSPRPCNGAVPVSQQEARRSVTMPQTCLLPSPESCNVKAEHLPAAVLTNVQSSAAPCGQRARGLHKRRYEALSCPPALGDSKRTLKWNSFVCLWLLVAVLACFSSAVLAFCLHLHSKVKDQSEAVETLIKDCRNLHRELDTSKKFVRNQYLSSLPGGEGGHFPGGNLQFLGLKQVVPDRILELLQVHKRRKRNAQDGYGTDGLTQEEINFWREVQSIVRLEVDRHHENIPRVHLKGMSAGSTEHLDQMNQYLLWQQDPDTFQRRGVKLVHVHHQRDRVKAIEIQQSGVYLIYSQVVINGSRTRAYRRDCTHETVVLGYHDDNNRDDVPAREPRVLMRGYLTQDGEGLAYNNTADLPHPRDSALQMGLFHLHRQSQVRIRIPHDDYDCRHIYFTTEFDASYFGLYKID